LHFAAGSWRKLVRIGWNEVASSFNVLERRVAFSGSQWTLFLGTENPRVVGSIPTLATIFPFNFPLLAIGLCRGIRWLCRICAVNFRVRGVLR
jgi:hypothetical protein